MPKMDMSSSENKVKSGVSTNSKWDGQFATVIKWIGAVTALMTVVAGLYHFEQFLSESRERQHRVTELLQIAENQQRSHRFDEAWVNLDAASKLDKNDRKIRRAQEDLAMAWLEDAHLKEGESFHQFVARLEPILDRGLLTAKSQRKADIQAHLGWAAFLRFREAGGLGPEEAYRQALVIDPNNTYAHAMLGHWILWSNRDVAASRKHFDAAIASGRAQSYARKLQLAALQNAHTSQADLEMIAVANNMRKMNQEVDSSDKRRIWNVYFSFLEDAGDYTAKKLLRVIPPEEHLSTFRWLFDAEAFDEGRDLSRSYWLGLLEEAAGRRAEALQTLNSLSVKLTGHSERLRDRTQAAIKRLSASP